MPVNKRKNTTRATPTGGFFCAPKKSSTKRFVRELGSNWGQTRVKNQQVGAGVVPLGVLKTPKNRTMRTL